MQRKQLNPNQSSGIFSGNFLNLVPFICSVMVIIIHQHNTLAPDTSVQARLIGLFSHGLCTAAVPMFMVMSGYLFFRNVVSYRQIFQKQTKRILTVLVPFLAWSFLYYALFAVASIFVPSVVQSPMDTSLGGIVRSVIFYEYAYPLWYMFQLCVYIALTPIIFAVLKNRGISIVVLACAFLGGLTGKLDITVAWNGLERNIFQTEFFTYFLFGGVLAHRNDWDATIEKFAKRISWCVIAVILLLASFAESILFDGLVKVFNERILVPLVFMTFFVAAIKISWQFSAIPRSRISTMVVYGIHSAVGIFLNKLLLERLEMPALVLFVVSTILVTAVSLVAARIIRWIKPVHWVLSGNR